MSSEEKPKITSIEKVKDPRRVAAGKNLAQISKEAKERKLRERIQEEKGFDYFFIVAILEDWCWMEHQSISPTSHTQRK